ncbi:hypothetical protein GQ457_18G021280 [Hibiscus cannabinus]
MDKNVISHVYNYGINMSLWIKIFLHRYLHLFSLVGFHGGRKSDFQADIWGLRCKESVRELDRFGFWFDSVAQAKQVIDKVVHFCFTLRWWHSYVYIV